MIFPTTGTTVSQLVRRCSPAAKLLTQLGIDWRSQRHATLSDVCNHAGVDARAVLEAMLAADQPRRPPMSRDWENASVEELTDHLVATHHSYLRQALPRIELLLVKAEWDHDFDRGELRRIREAFEQFHGEMRQHLVTEEEVLFPLIRQLSLAQQQPGMFAGTVRRSIGDVESEYSAADTALEQLRQATHELEPSPDASPAFRALADELRQLTREQQRHEYLERRVLFPRAKAIERRLTRE